MTTTTLRPNGAVSGSAVVVGAATAWQATSDNSDASYVDGNTGALFDVDLTTVSLPAGAVSKTITVRLRGSNPSGWASNNVQVRDSLGNQLWIEGGALLPAALATVSLTPYAAVAYSQAFIDGLRFHVDVHAASSNWWLREIYVDLTYALVPTVAVTAPTGVVSSTSQPTCTWTYTAGSDGDVQSRYQIRVFTAAQYGIGGFDPATSPCFYDSGIVVSAANSVALGTLSNSTTWRAYVNVAQTINGSPQWSGYSFSAFSTSFTTSDITSVGVTPDNVNARITVLVTRNGATPTWTQLEVQRTDDGGTTWDYIRTGNLVAVSGATWTIQDYEAANGRTVTYRARATYLLGGLPVAGAWVSSSATSWSMAVDWLKDTYYTSRNRQVSLTAQPVLTRDRSQGVNIVIGRSDPVVLSDVRQLSSGQLELITSTDTQANELLTLLQSDVLLLQTQSNDRFGSKYIAIRTISETAVVPQIGSTQHRFWAITFTEVLKPTDVGMV